MNLAALFSRGESVKSFKHILANFSSTALFILVEKCGKINEIGWKMLKNRAKILFDFSKF